MNSRGNNCLFTRHSRLLACLPSESLGDSLLAQNGVRRYWLSRQWCIHFFEVVSLHREPSSPVWSFVMCRWPSTLGQSLWKGDPSLVGLLSHLWLPTLRNISLFWMSVTTATMSKCNDSWQHMPWKKRFFIGLSCYSGIVLLEVLAVVVCARSGARLCGLLLWLKVNILVTWEPRQLSLLAY